MSDKKGNQPNNDRSETLNPNNPKHQKALDEHANRRNPNNPGNAPESTRESSTPGKGKRK